MPDFASTIAKTLNLRPTQVSAAIDLFDEGATVPFIARYRKEATGTLDEDQLRQVETLLQRGRVLEERRARGDRLDRGTGENDPGTARKTDCRGHVDRWWKTCTRHINPNAKHALPLPAKKGCRGWRT